MDRQIPINSQTTPTTQKWRPMPLGTPYPTDPFVEAAHPRATQYDKIMHSPAKLVLSNKMNKENKFEYLELDEDGRKEEEKETEAEASNATRNSNIHRNAGYDSDDEFDHHESTLTQPTIEEELNIMKITPELVGLCVCIIGFLGFLSCVVKRPDSALY